MYSSTANCVELNNNINNREHNLIKTEPKDRDPERIGRGILKRKNLNIRNIDSKKLKNFNNNNNNSTPTQSMAARLATQTIFVNTNDTVDDPMTSPTTANGEIATTATSNGQTIQQHVLQQKKIILQGTGGTSISVIDVVPIDSSVSSNESKPLLKSEPIDGSANNGQQVTAQVAVVQAQSPGDSTPHYITVTAVSSQDNVAPHSYQLQYVDSDLYSTTGQSQTQMYPVYAVGDYTPNGQQQYYTTSTGNYGNSGSSTGSASYSIVPVEESLLTSQASDSPQSISAEVAYIQGPQSTSSSNALSAPDPETTPSLSHATRVSPATVSWLLDNYETAEGVSLPRSTLYNHYMRHCNEHKLDAVNAASFGKLIRSVFTGLRTRRLGTRGNSKYHYYGIRVKPGSHLMSALDEKQPQNSPANNSNSGQNSFNSRNSRKIGAKPETYEACSQFLGDGSCAIPIFPAINLSHAFPDEISLEDVDTLRSIYREHCEAFLDAILNLEFSTVESLWREFWRAQDNNNGDECEEEKYLSRSKLYILCQSESIQNFIKQVDLAFYQNMVNVLIPDVLRPIPSSLTQAIRNFSKNLENWLSTAMSGCPDKILQIKMSTVTAFGQTLRRYTSLNHLAQAARAVLQNSSQIAQMLNDLNRVDFHNVHEQASWICQCDTNTVQRLVNDFKAALQQQNSLEQWASWLRLVVDSALEEHLGKPSYPKAARQFLLKWSFYSSMVIRDLTLRSAASFGSFHLIRLLYDEYMFFIVEHKVAQATNMKPIAVMSEINRHEELTNIDLPSDHLQLKLEPESKRLRS